MGVWKSGMQPIFLPFGSGKYQYDNLHWGYPISGPNLQNWDLLDQIDTLIFARLWFEHSNWRWADPSRLTKVFDISQKHNKNIPGGHDMFLEYNIYIDTYIILIKCQIWICIYSIRCTHVRKLYSSTAGMIFNTPIPARQLLLLGSFFAFPF